LIESNVSHAGLVLSCGMDDQAAIKDLFMIVEILRRNDVKVGGYDGLELPPVIEERDTSYVLYLGR